MWLCSWPLLFRASGPPFLPAFGAHLRTPAFVCVVKIREICREHSYLHLSSGVLALSVMFTTTPVNSVAGIITLAAHQCCACLMTAYDALTSVLLCLQRWRLLCWGSIGPLNIPFSPSPPSPQTNSTQLNMWFMDGCCAGKGKRHVPSVSILLCTYGVRLAD